MRANKKTLVEDLFQVTKFIKAVKSSEFVCLYAPLKLDSLTIECFIDASYGNLDDGGSQEGNLIFLCDGTGKRALTSWQSERNRRVTKSTLAAESLAFQCYVNNRSLVEATHSTQAVDDN